MQATRLGVLVVLAVAGSSPAYDYTDLWSTPEERSDWRAWIQEQSSTPINAVYHPVGQLHGLSARIRIGSATSDGVLEFLNGPVRVQLGLRKEDTLVATTAQVISVPTLREGRYDVEVRRAFRFAVRYSEHSEFGRETIALVDSDRSEITGLFNGHVPSLGKYIEGQALPLVDVVRAIENVESGRVEVEIAQLGWHTRSWINSFKPGNRNIDWFVKVRTPQNTQRDYIVDARTAAIVFRGDDRVWFAHQLHEG